MRRYKLKIKTFYAMDNRKLDEKVNSFLDNSNIQVVDVKFNHVIFYFSVLILYKEDESIKP
jgi:hypothetical protein